LPGGTVYPAVLDAFTDPDASAGNKLNSGGALNHDAQHGSANQAIEAIEAILGVTPNVIASSTLDTTPETVGEKTDQLYRLIAEVKGLTWDAVQGMTIEDLIGLFDGTTGHTHDGTDGDGPAISTGSHNHTASAGDGGVLTAPEFDSFLVLDQIATPATPASGKTLIYAKSDDKVYRLTDAAVETELGGGGGGGGGGTVFTDPYASPPGSPATGDQWWPEDTDYYATYDGADWIWYLQGHQITMPDNSLYSWHNQKSGGSIGSVDMTRGGIYLEGGPDSGDSQIFRVKTLPATPYTIEVRLDPNSINSNYTSWGLGVKNSSNDDFLEIGHYYQADILQLNVARGDDLGVTANNTIRAAADRMYRWFRITDDGTNRAYWVSDEGYHWIKFYQHGHTADVTPDRAYFWINPRNGDSFPAGVWLRHWKES
jgi:hypothetical protein